MFHPNLMRFVNDAILPLTSLDAAAFWKGFDDLINEFSSDTIQAIMDASSSTLANLFLGILDNI